MEHLEVFVLPTMLSGKDIGLIVVEPWTCGGVIEVFDRSFGMS